MVQSLVSRLLVGKRDIINSLIINNVYVDQRETCVFVSGVCSGNQFGYNENCFQFTAF